MKTLRLLSAVLIMSAFFSISSAFAEEYEIMKTDHEEFVGLELADGFVTCDGRILAKEHWKIGPTKQTCRTRPGPPQFAAQIEGTVSDAEASKGKLVIKDDAGKEHNLFVPESKQSDLANVKTGDHIRVDTLKSAENGRPAFAGYAM